MITVQGSLLGFGRELYFHATLVVDQGAHANGRVNIMKASDWSHVRSVKSAASSSITETARKA